MAHGAHIAPQNDYGDQVWGGYGDGYPEIVHGMDFPVVVYGHFRHTYMCHPFFHARESCIIVHSA